MSVANTEAGSPDCVMPERISTAVPAGPELEHRSGSPQAMSVQQALRNNPNLYSLMRNERLQEGLTCQAILSRISWSDFVLVAEYAGMIATSFYYLDLLAEHGGVTEAQPQHIVANLLSHSDARIRLYATKLATNVWGH